MSNLTYDAWSRAPRTIEQFAAYRIEQHTVGLANGPAPLTGAAATPTLFGMLGASPALGRFFHADKDRRATAPSWS